MAEHPRIPSLLTALFWAVVAFFVYRSYRLYLWDKRVSTALEAARDSTVAGPQLGWRSLNHLATAEGLPKHERAWLSSMLDDLQEQGGHQSPTFPACERCTRG